MQRKEAQRHISPVVAFLGIELEHGHEFHYGDAEFLEVRDLGDQAREGPALVVVHSGVCPPGEAPYVQFVDHRIMGVHRPTVMVPRKGCTTLGE